VDLGAHPPMLKLFYYIFLACILEGAFYVDLLHADLVIMPIFSCMPLLDTFGCNSLLFFG